jgi:hypothetical protein
VATVTPATPTPATLDEAGEPVTDTAQPGPQDMAKMVESYVESRPSDQFPDLVAVAPLIATGDADERFELLRDFCVDGLERRVTDARGRDGGNANR